AANHAALDERTPGLPSAFDAGAVTAVPAPPHGVGAFTTLGAKPRRPAHRYGGGPPPRGRGRAPPRPPGQPRAAPRGAASPPPPAPPPAPRAGRYRGAPPAGPRGPANPAPPAGPAPRPPATAAAPRVTPCRAGCPPAAATARGSVP